MLTAVVERNAYDVATENFDHAADALELENDVREMIKYPERILMVSVPVRMENGRIRRFDAYRVQHSTVRGPGKGGIRYPSQCHPGRSESARHVDDVEVRRGEHSLRRRQGRCHLRSQTHDHG